MPALESFAAFEPLPELVARHGLTDIPEEPFPNDGWSGASLTLLRDRDGRRFVLKRDAAARDWIARATNDRPVLREAWFASHGPRLPSSIRAPYLGVARDGDDLAILMPDLTGVLFDWARPISGAQLDRVLAGLADLHAYPWVVSGLVDGGPWCPLRERVTLICRASLERAGPAHDAVGSRLLPGWDAFDRLAPPAACDLIDGLGREPQRLLDALGRRPSTLLHGDLKLANVGIEGDGGIVVVDWQMVSVAPVAVELGWFLVANVASLPAAPDAVLERYAARLASVGQDGLAALERDDEDLAVLVGLLLRGWRKGADAEAGVVHGSGVTAADDLAWWCERAIEAANRLL